MGPKWRKQKVVSQVAFPSQSIFIHSWHTHIMEGEGGPSSAQRAPAAVALACFATTSHDCKMVQQDRDGEISWPLLWQGRGSGSCCCPTLYDLGAERGMMVALALPIHESGIHNITSEEGTAIPWDAVAGCSCLLSASLSHHLGGRRGNKKQNLPFIP